MSLREKMLHTSYVIQYEVNKSSFGQILALTEQNIITINVTFSAYFKSSF